MKEFLSQRGIAYREKYVDSDRQAAIEMVRVSGQRGVPVTVIGDEVVVGFDRARLERILAAAPARREQAPAAGKRTLGAQVKDAADLALRGGTPVQGAYVGGVRPGSAAEAAGLRAGDVVVAVNGSPISGVDALAAAIQAAPEGPVRLEVARGASRREAVVRWDG